MNIEHYSIRRNQAYKEWKNYVRACKENPKDQFLNDMKAVYNQLKSGRKLIDVLKIFPLAGVNDYYKPKLAISIANLKVIYCHYHRDGTLVFRKSNDGWREAPILSLKLKPLPDHLFEKYQYRKDLKTMVPKIPASIRPKGNLDKYYILWEVENWEQVPKDPYLLKRLTKNIFVILAAWNLTELERSVIAGRAW
jgi:hypothetical protein